MQKYDTSMIKLMCLFLNLQVVDSRAKNHCSSHLLIMASQNQARRQKLGPRRHLLKHWFLQRPIIARLLFLFLGSDNEVAWYRLGPKKCPPTRISFFSLRCSIYLSLFFCQWDGRDPRDGVRFAWQLGRLRRRALALIQASAWPMGVREAERGKLLFQFPNTCSV